MTPNKYALIDWAAFVALAIFIVEIIYAKLRDLTIGIWNDLLNIPDTLRHRLFWVGLGLISGASLVAWLL